LSAEASAKAEAIQTVSAEAAWIASSHQRKIAAQFCREHPRNDETAEEAQFPNAQPVARIALQRNPGFFARLPAFRCAPCGLRSLLAMTSSNKIGGREAPFVIRHVPFAIFV